MNCLLLSEAPDMWYTEISELRPIFRERLELETEDSRVCACKSDRCVLASEWRVVQN